MIKSLSPYYVNIPFVSPLTGATAITYTLNLFIWNGAKNDPPIEPQYQITKSNPTSSTGTDKINIARLVNDYINFTPNKSSVTELNDGNNQVWCRVEIIYTTDNPLDDDILQLANTSLVLKGYGYGLDGENSQPPTNKILIPIQDYKVNRNGFFNVPILIDEIPDDSEIVLTDIVNIVSNLYNFFFTSNFTFDFLLYQTRLNSTSDWVSARIFEDVTSPENGVVPVSFHTAGTFEARIYAYNELTGNNIYSNIFEYSL